LGNSKEKRGPCASPSLILSIIRAHREQRFKLLNKVTLSKKLEQGEGMISKALLDLPTLKLITDQCVPSQLLDELGDCPKHEFRAKMIEWLHSVYGELDFDPLSCHETDVQRLFRDCGPDSQIDRMVILFNGLHAAVGLGPETRQMRLEEYVDGVKMPKKKPVKSEGETSSSKRAKTTRVTQHDGKTASITLPSLLVNVLEELPDHKGELTREKRDRILETLRSTMGLCFKIVEK